MFLTLRFRKIYLLIAVALLFFLITGIIISNTADDAVRPAIAVNDRSPLLIIDAGHGGADGGAVAADGTYESTINLDIALRLDDLARFFGVRTLLTRDSEQLDYPENEDTIAKMKRWDQHRRLEIINYDPSAVVISIHQNKYPDPRPSGPQVLYGESPGSEELGKHCHELLNRNLCPENRHVASPASNNIYLMKNAVCRAILVECGFISNHEELSKLLDDSYQKKIAAILLAAYLCES